MDIKDTLIKILSNHDVHIFDIIIKKTLIKIIIDTNEGINIKMLTKISKEINNLEALELYYQNGIKVEVSSPGLEEPFKKRFQYTRNINKNIKVYLKNVETSNPFIGILSNVNDNSIIIKNKNGFHEFSFDKIEKSFLKIEIN